MMNPKNKAAMNIAFKQPNIAEACTKYVSNIFAFSRTCKENFNLTKKFQIRQAEMLNDHDDLSLYGSKVSYTNPFFSDIKLVSSESEFEELLEQFPSYHWLSLTKLEIYLNMQNDEYDYEKENFMESILTICFQKATNVEKLKLSLEEDLSYNHKILSKLIGGFKSKSLKTIHLNSSHFTYSITKLFESAPSFNYLIMMNPKNKAAMNIAFKQPNIAEACTKYVSNIFAFSRTCKENFNLTKKFQIRQAEKLNDHDELSLYGSKVCYTNPFLSEIKRVSSENEFEKLLEQFPSYHWLSLTKLEIYLNMQNDEYDYEKENFMESILTICFQKATNVEKLTLNAYEDMGYNYKILLKLLGGFKSESLKTIHLNVSFFTYSIVKFFETASSFKSLLKENFANFEHIHIDVYVDGYNKCLLDNLASLFKSSSAKDFDIFIIHMHFSSIKGMLDYNNIFSDIHSSQIKLVFSGVKLNRKCYKEFMDTPNAEELIQNLYFNNYPNLHEDMKIILDLGIYDKIKRLHFISLDFENLTDQNLEFVTASLKHLSNLEEVNISSYLVLEEDIYKAKKFMLSFPNTIERLKLSECDFDITDMGHKLAKAYPNLKKLDIKSSEKVDFDPNYFMGFQNIVIIKMDCVGKCNFTIPQSLRLLVINCATNRMNCSFEERKSLHFDNEFCWCSQRKLPLTNLVINTGRANYSDTCIHYKHINDLEIYFKNIEKYLPHYVESL
uniref:ANK_REP_REGION domain-containing protein n=1 Tax=Rhabditophanes sp. KR3021 TaxID=114890 RepID=A0AC35U1G5_9BILA